MKNNEIYQVESFCSRWRNGSGWDWKNEPVSDAENITFEVAENIIAALKNGKGAWAVWSDVIGDEAELDHGATDWEASETDDQYTIIIYEVALDGESRKEIYRKSIWVSDWARG